MKNYKIPVIITIIFEIVAITLTLTKNNIFYLFNFTYIGCALAIGIYLMINNHKYARRFVQLFVGLYMFIYLGIICRENMQIEGFWYYLLSGTFEAATIHYVVAKILGPLIFGRGWCGYACWSAMIFDFLPYKHPVNKRIKISYIRYIMFILSIIYVSLLFILNIKHKETIMFYSFIIGNIVYYIIGISLAFILKDNRAFCKYICPITIFLKPMSYFSLIRIKCDKSKCISCHQCEKVCPMNIDITSNSKKNSTECILCMECVKKCPKKAL